jgi:3-phosphoshikimate 1-carboxyvinyltransferase
MRLTVFPGYALRGEVVLPGDKSLSHRSALFAALADGESVIQNFLIAGVTESMLGALAQLKVDWDLDGTILKVAGRGIRGLTPASAPLQCGNSATTMRLLAGAVAAAGIPAVLDGTSGLRRRPMSRIIDPLRRMGVRIDSGTGGKAPLKLHGRHRGEKLRAMDYGLPVASAQVKTCLLLAALAAEGPVRLTEPALSRDHTERMLAGMGVQIGSNFSEAGAEVILTPPEPLLLQPLQTTLPGDFSSAAFLIVAALVTPGSEIVLRGVGLNPTRTGLLTALLEMGADIRIDRECDQAGERRGDLTIRSSSLKGISIAAPQVVNMIDEFPAFTAAAAYADGITTVKDAAELRHKESDRISAVCAQLRVLGVDIKETPDGYRVRGASSLTGGLVVANGDHRLGMALAVAGLGASAPVTVEGAEIISESLPGFSSALNNLGAQVVVDE